MRTFRDSYRLRPGAWSACALAGVLGAGLWQNASAQGPQFVDVTLPAGLGSASYHTDPQNPMLVMAGGGAAGDFNNDGWQDIFVLGGWSGSAVLTPDRLFINNHDGTFTDMAPQWGVDRTQRGVGVAVGDADGDGWLDIFISVAPGVGTANSNVLWHNNGNGTFTNIAVAAGVALAPGAIVGGGWGAAFGDYDLDGRLDLAVADWPRGPGANRLYRNLGGAVFQNVTATAMNPSWIDVQGFSPRFADMNGDGRPELLWTSDFGGSQYLVNNGNGTFSNATATAGVGLDGNGMGTSIADFNGDGRPDWFVTSIYSPTPTPFQPGTGNMLYINQGGDHYAETSQASGVKQGGWGWGSVAEDLDNDGLVDLAHTNGWDDPEFAADQTCVFENLGNGTFAQAAPACGVTHTGQGRGMIALDFDNDGRMDVCIFTNNGMMTLYRNVTTGSSRHFLRVFLSTKASHGIAPNGYGAHLRLTAGGVQQHRWICGGSNYLSQGELSAHFGLGDQGVASELRIEWPDGSVTTRTNLAADRTITIAACLGDWNADGTVSVQDIFDYLNDWFAGAGDVNSSGATTTQDIFDFLNAWFLGC